MCVAKDVFYFKKHNRIVKKVAVSYWEPGSLLMPSILYTGVLQLHTAAIQYVPSDETLIGVDKKVLSIRRGHKSSGFS